ncbi:hypothetical protein TeGR_g12069 [Tetraparma gracilis]|uniref:Uncharacterized protein n=1 Tax=Tetraparma gracilis TaxID=2962635 RepID=A0ABQ6MU34_9STRA|nr:hypothetical protein TeGR_g12069 [Tetraparma gracilis]
MSAIPMHDCATKSSNATGDFLVKGRPRSIYCVVRGDAYAPRSQAFRIEGGSPSWLPPTTCPAAGWSRASAPHSPIVRRRTTR